MTGNFIKSFFMERGEVNVKPNNEMDVLCPFPHDKGYEKRPSAHVNVEKGTFHCKTCQAEGRFSEGGLSEAGFISQFYKLPYSEAIKFSAAFTRSLNNDTGWEQAKENLLNNEEAMTFLTNRGITKEIVQQYELGYNGAGIVYPVHVHGVMMDKRTYNFNPVNEREAKIKSEKGASPLLYPFDQWRKHTGETILCAGENDTLLARSHGFNAITSTFGEGSFPKVFLGLFKGQRVYICYDSDEAGQNGSKRVAFKLKEAGADVFLIDLGLTGEKDDKDVTDFFMKHGKTTEDFQQKINEAITYDGDMYQEDKNKHYPLINLWDVAHGEYSGKRLSSRVLVMGKYDMPMETPAAVEWTCNSPVMDEAGKSPCHTCHMNGETGWWTLDDDTLEDLLELVEVDHVAQEKALNRFIGAPPKCPGFMKVHREKKHVQKVILAPDVETEDELSGYRMVEHYAYIVGEDLDDGQRYRVFFRRYPHPKTQVVVSVVDKVETSDVGINQFKMTPEIMHQLSQFQGKPHEVMDKLFELGKRVVGQFVPRQVFEAVNVMYHSVLDLRQVGKPLDRGYTEGLVIGASRTGKSQTAKRWQLFLQQGNMTNVKNASVAGLLGGADKLPSGGHRIKWGTIPRNHRGLLVLDEMSGIQQQVLSAMTDMRSSGVATLEKIVSGKAPAKTRMLWISNQRPQSDGNTRPISLYSNGVEIVRELVGTNEDIARFDFIVIVPETKQRVNPFSSDDKQPLPDNTPYRNLVYWAWTRNIDQITYDQNVETYLWQKSEELNERFYTEGLNIFGNETFVKLARIAASSACMCFSHDGTGETVVIRKEHVDWAIDFMIRCYDNNVFRFSQFVENERKFSTTTDEINGKVVGLIRKYPMIIKLLLEQEYCPIYNLKAAGGIGDDEFKHITNQMFTDGLISISPKGFMSTLRLRLAVDAATSVARKKLVDREKPRSFSDKIDLN